MKKNDVSFLFLYTKYLKCIYLTLAIIVLNIKVHAQSNELSVDLLFTKVRQAYESKNNYSLNLKYELFKDSITRKVEEFYTGKFIKNQEGIYSKVHNTEFIQIEDTYLKINHDEKAMLYKKQVLNNKNNELIDLTVFLNHFEKTKVSLKQDVYICELKSKKISTLPYNKVVAYISAKDFTINKQILYLSQQSAFKNAQGQKVISNPRLEITVNNSNTNTANIFSISKYVTVVGNQVKPSNNLKTYQLIKATN